mgnify:CR=1 FL=1
MNVVPLQQEMELGEPKFDDFWALWLKKVQKKESRYLFERLRDEHKMAAIIAAAEWRALWEGREPDFQPNPVKWISGERWEDELPNGYRRTQAHEPFKPQIDGKKYVPMPDHVRALIAKLKGRSEST